MNELFKSNCMTASLVRLSVVALITGLTACGGGGQKTVTTPTLAAATNAQESEIPDAGVPNVVPGNVEGADNTPADSNGSDGGSTDNTDVPDVTAEPMPTENNTPDQSIIDGAQNVGCDADPALFSSTMLELINAARVVARSCGADTREAVPTLSWNDQLVQAAVVHARDMTSNNFFSHDGSDGLGVSSRVESAGYEWRAVGENIAAGQLDVAEAHEGWMDSPGHCRNVMNSLFTEVGAACLSDPSTDFGTYWVVVFGDQR